MQPAIEISGLTKRYGEGDAAVDALKGVDMVIRPGEVVGLIGPSGSGKSTLLKCLGAVIEPSSTTRTKTRRLSRYGKGQPHFFQ